MFRASTDNGDRVFVTWWKRNATRNQLVLKTIP